MTAIRRFIKVVGEFGGHGYPGQRASVGRQPTQLGLRRVAAEQRGIQASATSRRSKMLNELREQGIAGGVYTQTTDVEGEINGLMTYDRKVIKIPAKELAELHRCLFEERGTTSDKKD